LVFSDISNQSIICIIWYPVYLHGNRFPPIFRYCHECTKIIRAFVAIGKAQGTNNSFISSNVNFHTFTNKI